MIVIDVRFLTAFYASANSEKTKAEWPPTPDRFFQSLVPPTVHRYDYEMRSSEEGFALLRWLEALPLPDVVFSPQKTQEPISVFVPVNEFCKDGSAPTKQPRFFPCVHPVHPSVYFVWPDEVMNKNWEEMAQVLKHYRHLGAAKSFAEARILTEFPPEAVDLYRLTLDQARGRIPLACYHPGRFDELETAYNSGRRADPPVTLHYTPYKEEHPGLFRKMHVFSLPKARPNLTDAARIATGVRAQLLAIAGKMGIEIPSIVAKDKDAHLAYLPLPFVGSPNSNGMIHGVGIGIPHALSESHEHAVELVLDQFDHFFVNNFRREVVPAPLERCSQTLNAKRWSRSSRCWDTVTPIEIAWKKDIFDEVKRHCGLLGYPEPTFIESCRFPYFYRSDLSEAFASPNRIKGRTGGFLTHIRMEFPVPVRGPVILGNGRNFGVGLFAATDER